MEEAMDADRIAQLQKQFAPKPKQDRAETRAGVDTAVLQKFKSLPKTEKPSSSK